jgi:integrase
MQRKRSTPAGVRARHSRSCRSHVGANCNCRPSWEAFVYLKRDGRKVRKTFPTQAAAKAWRADALAAANRGKLRAPARITVHQAAEEWMTGARAGTIPNRKGDAYKPSALRGYERSLKLRVLPALGHFRLSELHRADVQDFADRLLGEGLSPSTIQNTLDPIRVIFRRAVHRDFVAVDPTEGLELRRANGRRDRIVAPDDAARLLAALPDSERALWATALYAGLRRGELRGLRWSDINLEDREIRVRRGWDDEEGEIEGKTDAANRTVPILAVLRPVLAAHKLATGRTGDALVFGMTADHPFDPSTVRRRALAAWKAADLESIGLHEGRHTFAALMIAAGANAKVIQACMGHASITMTFDHYGHLMPGGQAEAARLVDNYLVRLASHERRLAVDRSP